MKLGHACSILAVIILAQSGHAEDDAGDMTTPSTFLSKSEILKETGINIFPVRMATKKLILPVFGSEVETTKVLLADDGKIYALVKAKGEKKRTLQIRTCGNDIMATPWKTEKAADKKGTFIASGKKLAEVRFKWTAAKEIQFAGRKDCLEAKKGFERTDLKVTKINGVAEAVFFVNYTTPAERKWTKLHKQYGEKAYKMSPPDCTSDSGFQKIGLLGAKCEVLMESAINCEGQGYQEGQFGRPLGTLEISYGKSAEKWLVFMAYGYEGDAYLGIRLTGKRPAEDKDIDFYVYSGC